jgi:hypothetical protein
MNFFDLIVWFMNEKIQVSVVLYSVKKRAITWRFLWAIRKGIDDGVPMLGNKMTRSEVMELKKTSLLSNLARHLY